MKIAGTTSRTDTSSGRPSSSTGDGVERRLPGERLGGDRPEVRDERREHEHRVDVGEDVGDDLEREALRDEQHQGGDDDGERRGLERRPPLWPQLLGELRDGHGLEAALPRRSRGSAAGPRRSASGRRPRRSRRRRAGAGSRPARARSGSGRRSRRRRAGRCRRSRRSIRPSGSPAVRPPPRRTGCGSRGAHGTASTPCRRRRRRARSSASRNWCTIARGPANTSSEWSSPWLASSWPSATIRLCDVGMSAHLAAEREERRPGARIAQRVEHARRPLGARAVVEGDGDHRLGCRAQADRPVRRGGRSA